MKGQTQDRQFVVDVAPLSAQFVVDVAPLSAYALSQTSSRKRGPFGAVELVASGEWQVASGKLEVVAEL